MRLLVGSRTAREQDTCQPTSDLPFAGPIPAEMGNLAALEELDLGGNQLSGEKQRVNLIITPDRIRHDSRVRVGNWVPEMSVKSTCQPTPDLLFASRRSWETFRH